MAKRLPKKTDDQRHKALASVWTGALAMLAVSIPLCAILRSPIIPIVVIIGTALVSLYVWNSGEKRAAGAEADALREKIKELEDRLSNVEVINRFEDRLAEKQARQSAEKLAMPVEPARAAVPERS